MALKAHFILKDKDILILLGSNEALDRLKAKKWTRHLKSDP